jgi:glutamyl-tRNA synthetase
MLDGTEKGNYGPYIQSKREQLGIYRKYAEELIKNGYAYYCYCTQEELDRERKEAIEKKIKFVDKCRNLTQKQIDEYKTQGRKPAVRFKMPEEGITSWNDLIHKELKFENKLLYDFVMLKTSGYPTYNFACVIDDHLMEMTHIIRGDDHISNTPLQINLYKALGWNMPEFAHLSMILGPDGTRLSKRHGATSIQEYKKLGFLPQTVRNYLALLGWSTSDSQQIFEKGELEEKFSLEGCQKNPAIFDNNKLIWMNGEYIRKMSKEELYQAALPYILDAKLDLSALKADIKEIVYMEIAKYKLLSDVPSRIEYFFDKEIDYEPDALALIQKEGTDKILSGLLEVYENLSEWNEKNIEEATRKFAKDNNYKTGDVFHPLRAAVSGKTKGATLFKMLEYLSKDIVLNRLKKSIDISFSTNRSQ